MNREDRDRLKEFFKQCSPDELEILERSYQGMKDQQSKEKRKVIEEVKEERKKEREMLCEEQIE